jgi:hypothetical protein
MRRSNIDYAAWDRIGSELQKRFGRNFKNDAADDEDETDNGDNKQRHFVDQLADLLVEAGSSDSEVTREDALRWLLHSKEGAALVTRMAQARKRDTSKRTSPMDTTEPVLKLAKAFVDSDSSFMPEADLTKMIEDYALRGQRSGETPAQCFSRVVCAGTAEGLLFRKALAVCKQVGPPPRGGDDAAQAYRKLEKLADRERDRDPRLSQEQAFAKAFKDNPALAAKAHQRPTASASNTYPFPR